MVGGVAAGAEHELVVVASILQGGSHFLIGQGPVAELAVEVGGAVLQEDTNRFGGFGLADQRRISVAAAPVRRESE